MSERAAALRRGVGVCTVQRRFKNPSLALQVMIQMTTAFAAGKAPSRHGHTIRCFACCTLQQRDRFWKCTECNWGGATELSHHVVSTVCEGLYSRGLRYTKKGSGEMRHNRLYLNSKWGNRAEKLKNLWVAKVYSWARSECHWWTFLADNSVGVCVCVCLRACLCVCVCERCCCRLCSLVDDDVDVVFWERRKMNTKLKPQCLIKCARWSQERRADTTSTPSFICKPPNAGLKYRK